MKETALEEIEQTFPARGLKINGNEYAPKKTLTREDVCPICGERFIFYPGQHQYKRMRNHRRYYFDRWSCVVKFDKANADPYAKRVAECRARVDLLESLETLPRSEWPPRERNSKLALYTMRERAETKLATAIDRYIKSEERLEKMKW